MTTTTQNGWTKEDFARTEYNRKVVNWLRKHAPYHVEELLSSAGRERGWWEIINHCRTEAKKSAADAGQFIREIRLNNKMR